jgi:hypothetical protein
MLTKLLLLSALVFGQSNCPGGVCPVRRGRQTTYVYAPPTVWTLTDSSGQAWNNPNRGSLQQWVDMRNELLQLRETVKQQSIPSVPARAIEHRVVPAPPLAPASTLPANLPLIPLTQTVSAPPPAAPTPTAVPAVAPTTAAEPVPVPTPAATPLAPTPASAPVAPSPTSGIAPVGVGKDKKQSPLIELPTETAIDHRNGPQEVTPAGDAPKAEAAPSTANAPLPTGVVDAGITRSESYNWTGPAAKAAQESFEAALADGSLVMEGEQADDSSQGYVTIIGTKEETRKVYEDFKPGGALAAEKTKWKVHQYDPNSPSDWAVKTQHLPSGGHPTILVQDASGKELGQMQSYEGGPKELQACMRGEAPFDMAQGALAVAAAGACVVIFVLGRSMG